jgi:hypothetical protein
MEAANEAVKIGTRASVTDLTEKLTMFMGTEEDSANHPLNTRIHNPYQYVYTCDSSKLLSAVRLSLKKVRSIEENLLDYLKDGGKYQKSKENEVRMIIYRIKNFEAILQVFIINLRHME